MSYEDHEDYFEDNTPYEYLLDVKIPEIRNIGFLTAGKPYSKGKAPKELTEKLKQLILEKEYGEIIVDRRRGGGHICPICNIDASILQERDKAATLAWSILLIPDKGKTYFAAPAMVYHYITKHNYKPPEEFIQAVLRIDTNEKLNGADIFSALVREYYEKL